MTTVFTDTGVQDSPLFKLRAAELESQADALKGRTKKLVAGAEQYCKGLDEAFHSMLKFASCIEHFCGGGGDEASVAVGGPTMIRFVHALRELSSFTELLRTQVEVLVCGRLGEAVAAQGVEVLDARRRLTQCTSDYDAARARHLGHKGRAPWPAARAASPEQTQQEMAAARAAAEEARFALARKLAEAEGRSRFAYLDTMASVMQAHLKHHSHGLAAMQSMGPFVEETLALAGRRKAEAAARAAALEALIHTQADEARAGGSPQSSPNGGGPLGRGGGGAAAGPLQMTAATTQLAAEIETFIRATQASGGTQVTALKDGYLLKQSRVKSKWQRRFFVLDSNGLFYYYSAKLEGASGVGLVGGVSARLARDDGVGRDQRPTDTVNLRTSTVKPGPPPDSPSAPYAFRLVSPQREYVLQAEDEAEAAEWMSALQASIACLLTGAAAGEQPSAPVRPTHRRHSSSCGAAAAAADPEELSLEGGGGPLGAGAAAAVRSFAIAGQGSTASSPARPSRESSFASPATTPLRLSEPPGLLRLDAAAAPPPLPPTPLQALRTGRGAPAGNDRCADCADCGPEWASLNLGVLLCIQCSGIHRQLGVHISKVRSLTLDTRAWEPPVVELFRQLGNAFASDVWEGGLAYGTPHAAAADDDRAADASPSAGAARRAKPGPDAPPAAKEAYVRAKYVERRFVRQPEDDAGQPVEGAERLGEALWEAAAAQDVKAMYYALACGADAARRYASSPAAQVVWEANLVAGGAQDQPVSPSNLGVSLLHACARSGNAAAAELLLQWGASVDARDVFGRTPLAYALLYDRDAVAAQLLRRGAAATTRDRTGRPAAALLGKAP
jgi:Arf-GAP/coiled-coil/ANK repeat/PH domain-containing protein